jgi:hypothetical protein
MSHRQITSRTAALTALAMLAFAAPAPAQDLRSPDARDAASQGHLVTQPAQDLRSPDARDAAITRPVVTQPAQDLRSPDARDAGLVERPSPSVGGVRARSVADAQPGGFDWGDAAIGAAGAIGLAMLATGTAFALRRRTHRDPGAAVS